MIMAAHSNTSPSPISSRPIFANSKISGTSNSAPRRSFTANKTSVLTDSSGTANAPSDFARRPMIGKEGRGSCPRDWDEKENDGTDHISKAYKFHSPAKVCKNFMAPTISAASKFTPSPRKRVLKERNDTVRTSSNSISDRKVVMSSSVYEDAETRSKTAVKLVGLEKMAARRGSPASRDLKRVISSDICSESSLESEISESGSSKLDLGLRGKIFGSSNLPSVAPIDADPFMPLYDPATDYSSPRTRFLHHKPNPKIEILLNKEREVEKDEFEWLENNIMSDMLSKYFSNCEDTKEEPDPEDVPASADIVIGATEEETESNSPVVERSEAFTANKSADGSIPEKNLVQENARKPRLPSRVWRVSVLWLLLLVCGSIYFTYSPELDQFDVKGWNFSYLSTLHNHSRIGASVKVNFDSVVRHVSHFSANSMSLIISKYGEGEKLGQLRFVNLSDMQVYTWDEGHLVTQVSEELDGKLEEDEVEDEYEEDEQDENFEGELETEANDAIETDSVEVAEFEKDYAAESMEDRGSGLEGLSYETRMVKSNDAMDECSSSDQKSSSVVDSTSVESSLLMEELAPSEAKFPAYYAMGISLSSLFAVALIAFAATYVRHHRYKTTTATATTAEVAANPINVQTSSRNCRQQTKADDNTNSYESSWPSDTRKTCSKRESLESCSSSTQHTSRYSSPSYGSFTSFQRIPMKNGHNGDEEGVTTTTTTTTTPTPVRRSSRIRNNHQVTK